MKKIKLSVILIPFMLCGCVKTNSYNSNMSHNDWELYNSSYYEPNTHTGRSPADDAAISGLSALGIAGILDWAGVPDNFGFERP